MSRHYQAELSRHMDARMYPILQRCNMKSIGRSINLVLISRQDYAPQSSGPLYDPAAPGYS